MKISSELQGARLNVAKTAWLVSMDAGHFRRLVRRGVFPAPKRTAKGMPYFDHELLSQIGQVLKSGVGLSGEEISFYRRKPKQVRHRRQPSRQERPQVAKPDDYITSVIDGCRQLGVDDNLLNEQSIKAILVAEFRNDRPALERVLPVVARRLFAGE